MRKTYRIRPHHLLCLPGFRGLGYSDSFVKNMRKVVETVKANPQMTIEVVEECDIICGPCPHRKDDKCEKNPQSEDGVREHDRNVLKTLGIKPNTQWKVASLYSAIIKKIGIKDKLEQLCKDCEWKHLGYCKEGMEKLINGTLFNH